MKEKTLNFHRRAKQCCEVHAYYMYRRSLTLTLYMYLVMMKIKRKTCVYLESYNM